MSKITWTHELRVDMYKRIVNVFGLPALDPVDTQGKPYGMSKEIFVDKLEGIGNAMGLGWNKGMALANQLAWLHRESTDKWHVGMWNNHLRNLRAAEEAGYYDWNNTSPQVSLFILILNWFKQLFK